MNKITELVSAKDSSGAKSVKSDFDGLLFNFLF